MPRQMPVYSENERRYRVQPSALPSRQLRHHSRHNPFPGIDLQFRLPSHPRPAVIGDFDNLIQLKVGSKSEGSLVLVLNCASIFFHRWTCEGARPTLCMTCCRWNDAGFSLASGTSSSLRQTASIRCDLYLASMSMGRIVTKAFKARPILAADARRVSGPSPGQCSTPSSDGARLSWVHRLVPTVP